MTINKKTISILIPTHNREKFLKRVLDYYSNFDINIYVCDSSKKKFSDRNLLKNINYHYYGGFSFAEKMSDILKKIDSKYIVLCADDDFTIPSSIKKCVEFLEDNNDYSSCHGCYSSFYKKGKKIIYGPTFMQGINRDINSKTAAMRIKNQLNPYMEQVYAVHRKENLIDIYNTYNGKDIKDINLQELLFTIIPTINGKTKVLPIFHSLRESTEDSDGNYTTNLDVFYKDKNNKKDLDLFTNILSKHLSKKEGIPIDRSKTIINKRLKEYMGMKTNERISIKIKTIQFIAKHTPLLSIFLRNYYFEIKRVLSIKNTKNHKGYPFYDKKSILELNKIEKYIKKHKIKCNWRVIVI